MAKSDRDLEADATLRRALEPETATADRLVQAALADGADDVRRRAGAASRWRRFAPAAAALVVLAMLTTWQISRLPNDVPLPRPAEPAEARLLKISNEDGFVTVTTPAGSKMIILPGEPS